ncbi:MAG: hypothetical protein ACERKD_16545 [Prolixibacteraceae bacterium]
MTKKLVLFFLLLLPGLIGNAQMAYRIKADILTKLRLPDSTFQISKGVIHYDKNVKKIIFDFTFPEEEKVVLFDTTMFQYRAGNLMEKTTNFLIPEQSFFHVILSGNSSNYGFKEANFEAKAIEKKKDLVITTYLPPENIKPYLSKIIVATKNKLLYSITMMGPNGNVLNRQILKNYHLINGLEIPYEILIASYFNEKVLYQMISLDNVVLNEENNNESYNHAL